MREWKFLKGFDNEYIISDCGDIYSLKTNKMLTNKYKTHDGYRVITLSHKNKYKPYRIHRLVAKTFIDNPNNFPEINHKDENKSNNHVSNLEWCDRRYNALYSNNIEKMNKSTRKKVVQLDKEENLIREYISVNEAGRKTGVNFKNISSCCLGHRKTAGGYIWKFSNDYNKN